MGKTEMTTTTVIELPELDETGCHEDYAQSATAL